jgi:hypothetical protein
MTLAGWLTSTFCGASVPQPWLLGMVPDLSLQMCRNRSFDHMLKIPRYELVLVRGRSAILPHIRAGIFF